MEKSITAYLDNLKNCINDISIEKIEKIINLIYRAYKNNRQIFIIGNGGSAATASHFACDLGKGTAFRGRPRMRVICLNDNIPLITAISNDWDYDQIFKEQLMNLVNSGDILISISCSGNSKNILNAVNYVKSKGITNIGFTGFGDEGALKHIVDEYISINSTNYGIVEDAHLTLVHAISQAIRKKIIDEW